MLISTGRAQLIGLFLAIAIPLSAQDKFHIVPQVADGRFSDGSYFTSTFMIMPWFESTANTTCNLTLYGLAARLENTWATSFAISLAAGDTAVLRSGADQTLATGYGTVTCSEYVYVHTLYTLYAANGAKMGEATVFSTEGDSNYSVRMVVDYRGGSRLGVAIANNTDIARSYRLTLGTRTAMVQVPARTSLARFVDELMTVPVNTVGLLKITATDFSSFGVIGLRFTGGVFTTIPAQ